MNRTIISLCLFALTLALQAAERNVGAHPSGCPAERIMTVSELFDLVEAGNRSLQSSRTGIEVAERAVESARSARLPDVSAALSVSYNGNILMTDRDFGNAVGFSSPHVGNSFTLQAQQTVYAGGAVDGGIRLAEVRRQQAEQGLALDRTQQRFMALGMYLDLFKADNSIEVYNKNIQLTERLIEDIKEKQAQGMALKNDVTRYELQMENLRLGLRKMQDNRAVLNYQLCNALGIENMVIRPDTTIVGMVTGDEADNGNNVRSGGHEGTSLQLDDWQRLASSTSPIMHNSALEIEAAKAQLKIAKSDYLPKVALFAADNFNGPYTYDIPPIDNNINVWYVGVGVSYSLSSLFKSNKNVHRAKAALRMSEENHAVTAEGIDNNMQQAYTLYRQSFVELQTQRKSVQLAAQNYDVINNRYLAQLALVTDMIDASDTKLDAELKEVDARVNIIFAWYKMKFIAGDI